MSRDTSSNLDTDCADLALAASDPDTRVFCGCGVGDGEPRAGTHDSGFEETNVVSRYDLVATKVY